MGGEEYITNNAKKKHITAAAATPFTLSGTEKGLLIAAPSQNRISYILYAFCSNF